MRPISDSVINLGRFFKKYEVSSGALFLNGKGFVISQWSDLLDRDLLDKSTR
jgi:hypothetical protein